MAPAAGGSLEKENSTAHGKKHDSTGKQGTRKSNKLAKTNNANNTTTTVNDVNSQPSGASNGQNKTHPNSIPPSKRISRTHNTLNGVNNNAPTTSGHLETEKSSTKIVMVDEGSSS